MSPGSASATRPVCDQEQLAELKTIFDLVDSNRDGAIDKQEVKMLLSILRIQSNEEEVEQFFKMLDSDKDGSVQFHEFCATLSKKAEGFDRDELLNAFAVLSDGTKPGHIAIQDLFASLTVIGKMPVHEARAIVQQLDVDRNNRLNYEDHVQLLTYKQPHM